MVAANFTPSMLWGITPEIGILILMGLVLIFDVTWKGEFKRNLGWLTALGLSGVAIATIAFATPGAEGKLIFGGMLREDWLSFTFQIVFLIGAAITALFAMDTEGLSQRGEFYLLLMASTMGMCLMAGAADLIMLFLAIETTSIPLYALAGFWTRDNKSTESGFKYFLFGAAASAVMLYGMSLMYGFAGTTQIYNLIALFANNGLRLIVLLAVFILVMVGFGFKTSLFPFHFWAPDVYEGAPTPIAGFLSTASKAAGFAVMMRFFMAVFPPQLLQGTVSYTTIILATLSVGSMFVGNLMALNQKNMKRLLAYSSIGQAGYMMLGVIAGSSFGIQATTYYLIAYLATNMVAFGVVNAASKSLGTDDIAGYAGLSRRSPGLALALLVSFLSLGGIPPFGGFVAKILVFLAAIQSNLVWLVIIGVINSIVALYYYLNVIKVVYQGRSEDENRPIVVSRPWKIALTVCVIGIVLMGTWIGGPWFTWSQAAAVALF